MPEPKQSTPKQAEPKPTADKPAAAKPELKPAGEASDPAVHQLLAELATARANGEQEDAQEIVDYLAELGYSA